MKDLVRQWTPNVERAEIYTSEGRSRGFGYVRIKGLEAAKKVQGEQTSPHRHLNEMRCICDADFPSAENLDGYVWNGRALVAKLGNLQYDCPVGGATATKLGPGQILPPHYAQAGQSTFQNVLGGLSGPAEWLNSLPPSGPLPSSGNSWELDAWYRHTYQECTYWNNQAAFHTNRSKELWGKMSEATQLGRLGEVRDFQKQFNEHREAARQASDHAMGLGRSLQMRSPLNTATIPASGEMYSHSYLSPPMLPYGPSGYHSQLMLPATPISNPTNPPTGMESSMTPGSIPQAPASFMMPVNTTNIHVAPSPFYVTLPNGLPVNLSHGAVQTECRSVFIGNLPYGTTWKELKEYLEGSTRVEVPRNADNRAKGHAIATFESSEAANQACLRYNNTPFKGRQLRVRMDRHYETKRSGADMTPGVGGDAEDTRTASQTEGARGTRNAESQRYMPPVVVDGSNLASGSF